MLRPVLRNSVKARKEIVIPQINGYNVYKADLHTHSIYSDAQTTPEWRVTEAWYDGLDIIAMAACELIEEEDSILLTSGSTIEAFARAIEPKGMLNVASEVILLADSTKLGKNGFGKICDMSRVDTLITDSGLPQSMRKKFEDEGVRVIIAKSA